ncbi:MAG: preprotein translocase subunit SecG [Thermodesulfovibrionales bacterium]|nr:preprotein translocase subunit SecG [Thermodesulfovibrionales bacterium]
MEIIVTIIHIIVCLFLVFIVLIQSGKGAEIGAAFGGSSQTLFGSRGAATFLNKLTTAAAIVFMLTSLALTFVTTKPKSIIKDTQVPVQQAPQQIPQEPVNK